MAFKLSPIQNAQFKQIFQNFLSSAYLFLLYQYHCSVETWKKCVEKHLSNGSNNIARISCWFHFHDLSYFHMYQLHIKEDCSNMTMTASAKKLQKKCLAAHIFLCVFSCKSRTKSIFFDKQVRKQSSFIRSWNLKNINANMIISM